MSTSSGACPRECPTPVVPEAESLHCGQYRHRARSSEKHSLHILRQVAWPLESSRLCRSFRRGFRRGKILCSCPIPAWPRFPNLVFFLLGMKNSPFSFASSSRRIADFLPCRGAHIAIIGAEGLCERRFKLHPISPTVPGSAGSSKR